MENSVFRPHLWPVSVDELLVAADRGEGGDHEPHRADDHENGLHEVSPDHGRQPAADREDGRDGEQRQDRQIQPYYLKIFFMCENIFVCDYFTFLPGEVHGELDEERPRVQICRDLGEDVQQQRQHGEEHADTLTPEPHPVHKSILNWNI